MNSPLLDLPDRPEQLVSWLEAQLRGDHLATLVAELSAVHGTVGQPRSLADVLANRRNDVLQQGLGVLEPSQFTALLLQPTLLWELSELILVDGGPYWDDETSAELQQQVDEGWRRLRHSLPVTQVPSRVATSSESHVSSRTTVTQPATPTSRWRPVIAIVASAAVVAIAFWLGRPEPGPAPGWGFNAPGALAVDMNPSEYLQHLARSANAWYNKTPETSAALQERLGQFRAGCESLLVAEHSQLDPTDKEWLLERCQAWIGKIDGHLADIAAGDKSFEALRDESNATIDGMIDKLNERATQV